jgi:hypothetical protein
MLCEKFIISGYFALSKGEHGKSHKWVKEKCKIPIFNYIDKSLNMQIKYFVEKKRTQNNGY